MCLAVEGKNYSLVLTVSICLALRVSAAPPNLSTLLLQAVMLPRAHSRTLRSQSVLPSDVLSSTK
jgi:hypothetical protein